MWGAFVWNMFDFGSSSRFEGESPGINDKGLVTYDLSLIHIFQGAAENQGNGCCHGQVAPGEEGADANL